MTSPKNAVHTPLNENRHRLEMAEPYPHTAPAVGPAGRSQTAAAHQEFAVPVMPGTLLGLELLMHRPALDLSAASDLIREDPGALLHLFALIAEEHGEVEDDSFRLEDLVASLPSRRLLQTFTAAGPFSRGPARFAHFAQHGVAIGRSSQTVADSLGLPRHLALLVGTLHDLGNLPGVLGWKLSTSPDPLSLHRELSRRFHLPPSLRSSLDAVHADLPGSIWVAVVKAAHDLIGDLAV